MKEDNVFSFAVNQNGTELKGACSYDAEDMVVSLNLPGLVITALGFFPFKPTTEEIKEQAKNLLIELYNDYNLIILHKEEIKAALPDFEKKREALLESEGRQNGEVKAGMLFSRMIREIIGKRCCIDALEAKVTGIILELDNNKTNK